MEGKEENLGVDTGFFDNHDMLYGIELDNIIPARHAVIQPV